MTHGGAFPRVRHRPCRWEPGSLLPKTLSNRTRCRTGRHTFDATPVERSGRYEVEGAGTGWNRLYHGETKDVDG